MATRDTSPRSAPSEAVGNLMIVLTERKGTCVKTEALPPHYTAKGRRVQWVIVNGCRRAADVALNNFTPKGSAKKHFPFTSGKTSCTVPAGGTETLKLVVGGAGPEGQTGVFVYTYDVEVNGKTIDPEIIIEWF